MSPGSQWEPCCPPTPSTGCGQSHLLAGPGPSPEWGGGDPEHVPSGEGDLFYGLSLCIDGFYWPMGSSGFHNDLAQEIRLPRGWGAEAGGGLCLPGGAGHRVGMWCDCSIAPHAEQVLHPHQEGNQVELPCG